MASSVAVGERTAWVAFLRAHNRVIRAIDQDLERNHGLSLPEFEVLLQLKAAGAAGARMGDLAASVLLSPSGVTRLVDRMVAAGLVTRCEAQGDGRGVLARITAAGEQLYAAASPTHAAGVRREFFDRLDAAERESLVPLLESLAAGAPPCPEAD